jgi:hypothetical protein
LEREFTFHGHVLRQIFREKDVAVYSRSFPGRAPHELELVIVRKKKQSTLPDGSIVAASEAYPSSSEWGKYGWSFPVRKEVFVLNLAKALVSIEEHRPDFVRKKACYPKGLKAENQEADSHLTSPAC